MSESEPSVDAVPLYVDLDGTLTKVDLLAEGAMQLLKRNPAFVFLMGYWLVTGGKAGLKAKVAARVDPDAQWVPLQQDFVAFLRSEAGQNRAIYLATASDLRYAQALAKHVGCFVGVLASDGKTNLSGARKLDAILEHSGRKPFDYAGNDWRDVAIWRESRRALLVNAAPGIVRRVKAMGKTTRTFEDRPRGPGVYLRALRIHQWLKNLLLVVPLLTAQRFEDPLAIRSTLLAFVAFSLCASATYVCNDLLDLAADRRQLSKRMRPLAAGDVSVLQGALLIGVTLAGGIAIALLLPPAFRLTLLVYVVVTLAYSLRIKQYVVMDVICLGILYSLRILAGAAAIGVVVSSWLLAFSMFLFLSLALVKRCSELAQLGRDDVRAMIAGRDYRVADTAVLSAMGVASAYVSVLVLALFVDSPSVALRYASPDLLWLMCPAMLFWVSRLWIKTTRGEINEDPILYSMKDRGSWVMLAVALAVWTAAQLPW